MTDNGLVALAERLEEYFGPSWWPGLTDVTIIAADTQIAAGKILGERGVFLPDGLITRKVLRTWQEGAARDEATIATLRAALEMVVAQKWWCNWGTGANAALDAARVALATAKETQPTDGDTTEPDPNHTRTKR